MPRPFLTRPGRVLCALALGIVTGCADTSAASLYVTVDTLPGGIPRTMTTQPIDSGRWNLAAVRSIQPPELDSAELLQPQDVALAEDGTVFVSETKPAQVKVFGPDGRYLRTIGREGGGPGEFRVAYIAVRGDTLVVQDPQNARATSFNWKSGEMIAERRTACCYWNPIAIDGSGRAVVRSTASAPDSTWRNTQTFVRFPIGATSADTVYALERQDRTTGQPWLVREGGQVRMGVQVPYQARAHFAIDPTGGFVTGWTGDYMLRASSDGRDTTAVFGRPHSPDPVTDADKSRLIESRIAGLRASNANGPSEAVLRASFDASLIPSVQPAYEAFTVDGAGRRWVRRVDADTTVATLDLFDRDGRWLDVVRVNGAMWPRSAWASIGWSKTEAAVLLESEDGRPIVRVYRIDRRAD